MRYVVGLCLLVLAAPALASNPGEPLDCSDWVFLEPGLSCSYFVAPGNCGSKGCDGFGDAGFGFCGHAYRLGP